MPESLIAAGPSPTEGGDAVRTRPAVVRRVVLASFVAATITAYVLVAGPTMLTAIGSVATASPLWLSAGGAATVGSMVAFALLRSRTLAVGGAHISLARTAAVSYGAGAVHTTLPAGAVFSTTYAFRHLRAWGASASATTWSMTITGVLSTVTLSAVGLLGVVLTAGTGGSPLWPIVEIVIALMAILLLVRTSGHPDALAHLARRGLVGINRARRRPAETGLARLAEITDDLRAIRPSGRDWLVSAVLALANWALDLACLAACSAAVGVHVSFPALLITYTAGMAAGSLLPLPAGLGAVETAMTVGLTVAGAAASPALAAVLLYRLLSTGSVVVIGWLVVALQRIERPRTLRPKICA